MNQLTVILVFFLLLLFIINCTMQFTSYSFLSKIYSSIVDDHAPLQCIAAGAP